MDEGLRGNVLRNSVSLAPGVVLMDSNMPEPNGIEATPCTAAGQSGTATLIIAMFDDDRGFAAMRAGTPGYPPRRGEAREAIRAVRAVTSSEAIFSLTAVERLIRFFAAAPQDAVAPAFPDPTPCDREIPSLMAQG